MFWRTRNGKVTAARVSALDALRTNVMIADTGLNITYVNQAVLALMQDAEADLKKELPGFSAGRLVGTNIDTFHKNPAYQRTMLTNLKHPHNATISVGPRRFDLLVTPLFEKGARTGFVVEWSDAKERLLNVDYSGQIAAINRAQATIEFTLDGAVLTANRKFLDLLGYGLAEIQGKPHSMFVDPVYRTSPEYQQFWENLRRGEFQAAQFKRIGKNGHEVWIEASYNPILDINGKPFKVVEFATDITAQVQMLANLKTLIDRNFGEIDGAVKLSSSQADLATGAVHTTSGTVQTMAASSEELAASVREISDMMMKSKAAVDSATAQVAMADQATQSLTAMSTSMGGIVAVISGIAQQINLLALNATIEAARAGDAGRGFAVVASEVKSLAQQAAQATSQISTEIGTLQSVTKSVVEALGAIVGAIELVQQFVTGTASSVEEQSVVTQQMSQGMQTASLAMTGINDNMAEITGAVTQVAQAMGDTRKAASVLVR